MTGIFCALLPALREPFTGLEQLSALVSFLGVILIARPSWLTDLLPFLGEIEDDPNTAPGARALAVLIMIVSIIAASSAYTSIRWIGNRAHSLVSVFYFSGLVTVLSFILVNSVPSIPNFNWPQGDAEWTCLVILSLVGFAAQWSLTKGLQLEKAGRGIQLMYTQLIFAGAFEWLLWGDVPGFMTWVGGGLIIVSLLTVNLWKEKHVAARKGVEDEERAGLLEGADSAAER